MSYATPCCALVLPEVAFVFLILKELVRLVTRQATHLHLCDEEAILTLQVDNLTHFRQTVGKNKTYRAEAENT